MGKQTDNNINKSSKKKYSFTGQRIIGDLKSIDLLKKNVISKFMKDFFLFEIPLVLKSKSTIDLD